MIGPDMKSPVNLVAAIGLALGGVFGLVGTVVTERNLQAASWGIDGVGLVVAASLLALRFFRKGNDFVAAGFLVFAIGESIMLAGTAHVLPEMLAAADDAPVLHIASETRACLAYLFTALFHLTLDGGVAVLICLLGEGE